MSTFAQRLATCGKHPSDAQLLAFAEEVARKSASKRLPETSAAAYLRHARSSLSQKSHTRLCDLVREAQSTLSPAIALPRVESPYCLPAEAAAILRINTRTLLERLKHRIWRQFYGWACFDGHHWQIPRAAILPETRAAFLAAQPNEEPFAHVLMLPRGAQSEQVDFRPIEQQGSAA